MQLDANTPTRVPPLVRLASLNRYIDEFQCGLSELDYNSGLTGSGYPLEVSFTNRSELPRFTIDPFCGSLPAAKRLQATLDLLKRDFKIDLGREKSQWLKELLPRYPKYGAWLGLREKLGKVSPKLYVEVDPSCEQRHWPSFSVLQPHDRCLAMLGVTPSIDERKSDDYELYYRSRDIHPLIFPALLSPIKAIDYAGKLQSEIESLYGRKFGDCLPGSSIGFSYAIGPEEEAESLTLFIFCRSLFGRDRQTRQRFEQLIESKGLCPDYYLRLTEPSITRASAKTQHGIFATTISSHGDITHGVGYCPVGRQDNDG